MNGIAIAEKKPRKEGTRMSTVDVAEIDALILDALGDFMKDIVACEWCGKEHDYVNRFAHGFLIPRCAPSSFLHDPPQVGIEVGVAQPRGIGSGGAARKDLVIWAEPGMSCWNPEYKPVYHPTVVMEWKVVLAGEKLRATVTGSGCPRTRSAEE